MCGHNLVTQSLYCRHTLRGKRKKVSIGIERLSGHTCIFSGERKKLWFLFFNQNLNLICDFCSKIYCEIKSITAELFLFMLTKSGRNMKCISRIMALIKSKTRQ